ncbi:MAG: ribbon-helix-helix domain-containing protein [Pseudomonadota bacterium]
MANKSATKLVPLLEEMSLADCAPFFRAITTSRGRRALKLERPFWSTLEDICQAENISLGELIIAIEDAQLTQNNLASALRQFALAWSVSDSEIMKAKLSTSSVQALLEASPSPAFAVSSSKSLRAYNRSFLRYIRLNLPNIETDTIGRSLRLQIDVGIDELADKLAASENKPIAVGFAIGAHERRIRGRINAIKAPIWSEAMILGFIVD